MINLKFLFLCLFAMIRSTHGSTLPPIDKSRVQCMYTWSTTEVGETVTLPCIDHELYPELKRGRLIEWKKGTSSLFGIFENKMINETGKYLILHNGSLVIQDITEDDYGLYLCSFKEGTIKAQVHGSDWSPLPEPRKYVGVGIILIVFALIGLPCFVITSKTLFKILRRNKALFDPKEGPRDQAHHRATLFQEESMEIEEVDRPCCCKTAWTSFTAYLSCGPFLSFFFLNTAVCLFDEITDVFTAILHHENNDSHWMMMTIILIFMPSIIAFFQKLVQFMRGGTDFKSFVFGSLIHLPFVQLMEHIRVLKKIAKLQHLHRRDLDTLNQEHQDKLEKLDEQLKVNFTDDQVEMGVQTKSFNKAIKELEKEHNEKLKHHDGKYAKKIAEIECNFQRFKVIDCLGESAPQAVLQIAIGFKQASHFNISNLTVISSLLSVVATFTGLFVNMPEDHAHNAPIKNPTFCKFMVAPFMMFTVLPRLCNLGLLFSIEKYWIVIPTVIASIIFIYAPIFTFWLNKNLPQPLPWHMSFYSLGLSLLSPCIRLKSSSKKPFLIASFMSFTFHIIYAVAMLVVLQINGELLYSCDDDVHLLVHYQLVTGTLICLGVSLGSSWILATLSDGESRQLMSLKLYWTLRCNSQLNIYVYQEALLNKWYLVLRKLIQRDINMVQGKTHREAKNALANLGHINGNLDGGKTVVHLACGKQGNKEIVDLFLQAPDYLQHFLALDKHKRTPLHIACYAGNVEVVEMFRITKNFVHLYGEQGTILRAMDGFGETPFTIVVNRKTRNLEIAKLLINASDYELNHYNGTNIAGHTPFTIACINSDVEIVKLFLESNQFDQLKFKFDDANQKNLWHFLAEEKPSYAVSLLTIMDLISAKLAIRSCINDKDKNGRTAYHYSCANNNVEAFKWFTDNASTLVIDLDAKDSHGMTDFHLACEAKAFEIIKILLKGPRKLAIMQIIGGPSKTTFELDIQDNKKSKTLVVTVDSFENPSNINVYPKL